MRLPLWSTVLAGITLTTTALALSGCGHRDAVLAPRGETVTGLQTPAFARRVPPGSLARPGQFRRIWPHEDGRAWAYRLETRVWDTPGPAVYPSPDQVPPAPTLDDAAALLGHHPIGDDPVVTMRSYGLRFHGLVTTLSGVTRQNLEETLGPEAARATPAITERTGQPFMRLLKRARPDLARKIGALDPTPDREAAPILAGPTLLHGYAWEQTDEWIGTYGDLNREIAWIFLTPDLAPGSEFTLQLVPDLASDVFLHARVLGRKNVLTEAGVFRHALKVLYLVDLGVTEMTNIDGDALGYSRSFLYGTVSYAPGVGPVHSYERIVLFAGDPLGPGTGDLTSSLVATEPGARDALVER